MLIKEYRVVLPLTVEEYQIGQLYAVARASKEETKGSEGVEILKNEPFENETEKGQYTQKIYHIGQRLPGWMRTLLPVSLLQVYEDAWNAYPHCRTVLTSPFFGEKFKIVIETQHNDNDKGDTHNALNLDEKTLKEREVVLIDIANDAIDPKDYKETEDPKKVHSEKANRGPLQDNWMQNAQPVMCAYKLVSAEARIWGFQGKLENKIHEIQRSVFTKFHRQVFSWLDSWFGLTISDIRAMEEATKAALAAQLGKEQQTEQPANL